MSRAHGRPLVAGMSLLLLGCTAPVIEPAPDQSPLASASAASPATEAPTPAATPKPTDARWADAFVDADTGRELVVSLGQ